MSNPTGMNTGTGLHYHNVAAQMNAYVNNRGGQSYPSYGGYNQMPMSNGAGYGTGYGTQPYYGGGASGGGGFIDPVIAQDMGGFARKFMRNLFM